MIWIPNVATGQNQIELLEQRGEVEEKLTEYISARSTIHHLLTTVYLLTTGGIDGET